MDIFAEVAPGFEAVQAAFEDNLKSGRDVGASCCVYWKGRKVVDLAGGLFDEQRDQPYTPDTLQLIFSTTKGATAIAVNQLIERGDLDLDAPVASYWPEFAQAGKRHITVRWLLDHRAGLIDVDKTLTFEEMLAWDPVITALEETAPLWEPGTAHGYHATTYGWLAGELVRRVTGKSLGRYFADEVAGPLGLDLYIGLPTEHHARVSPSIPFKVRGSGEGLQQLRDQTSLMAQALGAPSGTLKSNRAWNKPELWAAEIPAANGIGNARSVARMYAATVSEVDGVRLLSQDTANVLAESQNEGRDKVLIFEIKFCRGFMAMHAMSKRFGERAFGHYGAGGSVGYADPEHELAFAYVMNRMEMGLVGDPRSQSLIRAVNAAIGKWPVGKQ
jgi:CubicO group peptidase (beta-lactamase class C family)